MRNDPPRRANGKVAWSDPSTDPSAQASIGDRWTRPRADAATAGIPLGVAVAMFGLAFLLPTWPWLSGAVTIPWDAKSQFYPQVQFLATSIAHGEWPWWSPNVFAGWPQISDPQSLLFSPLHVLLAAFNSAISLRAFDAVTFAYLLLGGIGIILFFHDRGWHMAGALVAAMAFALGGSANARIQHTGQVISLVYLPIALWLLARTLERSSWRAGLAAGAVGGLLAIGRDQVALLSLYVLAGFVLAHWLAGEHPLATRADEPGSGRVSAAAKPDAAMLGKAATAAAPAGSVILAAAERIQDVAWTMRERGLDPRICEQIEALASSILAASPLRNPDDQRAAKLTEVLQYLERRIDTLLEACAAIPATEPAPTAHASAAEEAPAGGANGSAPADGDESGSQVAAAADDGAAAHAAPSDPPPVLSWSGNVAGFSTDVSDGAEPPAQASEEGASAASEAPAASETESPTPPSAPDSQAPACEVGAASTIVSEPVLEAIAAGDRLKIAAAAIAPPPEVARQRSGPTPLPAIEFSAAALATESAATAEEAPAAEALAAANEPIPQPPSEPTPATETVVLELEPLVVSPVGPREAAADAPRPQLELDPIAVEPLFPPAAGTPDPERAPAPPPGGEVPVEPEPAPAAAAPGPAFRPPEVAMVFLVEGTGPTGEDEPPATETIADNEAAPPQFPPVGVGDPQLRPSLGETLRAAGTAEIAEVLLEPLPVPPPPAAPVPPLAMASRQPSPSDCLVALKAMSEEERMALFT
jgi:hypothetical protein